MSNLIQTYRESEDKFDSLCIVNKFGECKYWNPSAFGYAEDDNEALTDIITEYKDFIKLLQKEGR